ncbi:MAG: ATP synthase F1 subunit delta [Candidatus Babeliales bacterium]|nr:ATP synthase F1 subunit delta [Candidatus Babeliales bacterium]
MNIKDSIIAKRYAVAYLNLSLEKLDNEDLLKIRGAYDFLLNNRQAFFLLTLPNISLSDKTYLIDVFLKKFNLSIYLKDLFLLLVEQNRIYLVKDVLKAIITIYQVRRNIMIFDISSSDSLDKNDIDVISKFLYKNTKNEILPLYKIDKSLIAGIKLQSGSFLWEYSIKKQLASTKKLLYKLR